MADSYKVGEAPWEKEEKSYPVGSAPWETMDVPQAIQEQHPEISDVERFTLKSLGTPKGIESYLKQKFPDAEIRNDGSQFWIRMPNEKDFKVLDPDTGFSPISNPKEAIKDIAEGIPSVLQGALEEAPKAAILAATPIAPESLLALPTATALGGSLGAAGEYIRQKLGTLANIPNNEDFGQVAESGIFGAAGPLAFGQGKFTRGLPGGTYEAFKQKVGPVIGEYSTGIPRSVIKFFAKGEKNGVPVQEIFKDIDNAGVPEVARRAAESFTNAAENKRKEIGQEMSAVAKEADTNFLKSIVGVDNAADEALSAHGAAKEELSILKKIIKEAPKEEKPFLKARKKELKRAIPLLESAAQNTENEFKKMGPIDLEAVRAPIQARIGELKKAYATRPSSELLLRIKDLEDTMEGIVGTGAKTTVQEAQNILKQSLKEPAAFLSKRRGAASALDTQDEGVFGAAIKILDDQVNDASGGAMAPLRQKYEKSVSDVNYIRNKMGLPKGKSTQGIDPKAFMDNASEVTSNIASMQRAGELDADTASRLIDTSEVLSAYKYLGTPVDKLFKSSREAVAPIVTGLGGYGIGQIGNALGDKEGSTTGIPPWMIKSGLIIGGLGLGTKFGTTRGIRETFRNTGPSYLRNYGPSATNTIWNLMQSQEEVEQ